MKKERNDKYTLDSNEEDKALNQLYALLQNALPTLKSFNETQTFIHIFSLKTLKFAAE